MARAIFPHELCDADFSWLISTYRETNPSAVMVESPFLPIVLFTGVPLVESLMSETEDLMNEKPPVEEGGEEDTEKETTEY